MNHKSIADVKDFWNSNPLFSGESNFEFGTKEFFEEHKSVVIEDCFAGKMDESIFPQNKEIKMLDLGCGIGLWVIEFLQRGFFNLTGADLAENAIITSQKRCKTYGFNVNLEIQNADSLSYPNEFFDHVNCQGVIHHTPNTERAIQEIQRVLKKGGSASISVYHKNFFIRNVSIFSFFLKFFTRWGGA